MHKILNVHLKIPKYFCGVTLPTPPHDLDGVLTGVGIPHTSRVQKWGTSHHRVISPGRRRARKSEPDRRPDPGPRTGSIHPGRPGTGPTPGDPKIGRTDRFRRPRRTGRFRRPRRTHPETGPPAGSTPETHPGRPRSTRPPETRDRRGGRFCRHTGPTPRPTPGDRTGPGRLPRDRTHPQNRETGPLPCSQIPGLLTGGFAAEKRLVSSPVGPRTGPRTTGRPIGPGPRETHPGDPPRNHAIGRTAPSYHTTG